MEQRVQKCYLDSQNAAYKPYINCFLVYFVIQIGCLLLRAAIVVIWSDISLNKKSNLKKKKKIIDTKTLFPNFHVHSAASILNDISFHGQLI